MKKTILAMLVVALLSVPAMANTDYNICFGKIDGDYDGEMTEAEFSEAFQGGDRNVFKAADGDKNGTVSHEEWEEFKEGQGFEETHDDG